MTKDLFFNELKNIQHDYSFEVMLFNNYLSIEESNTFGYQEFSHSNINEGNSNPLFSNKKDGKN